MNRLLPNILMHCLKASLAFLILSLIICNVEPINILLSSPQNNTNTQNPAVSFNYTVTGSNNTYNCSLIVNDTQEDYSLNTLNNTPSLLNATYLLNGTYYWKIICSINETTYNESNTYLLTVTNTTPTLNLSLISPTDNSTINQRNTSLNYSYGVNGTDEYNCSIYVWNNTGLYHIGQLKSPGPVVTYNLSLPDNNYSWNIYCINSSNISQWGWGNETNNWTFKVNASGSSLSPTLSITLNTPVNNTSTTETNISFNYTVVGSNNIYNCTLYLNKAPNNSNNNTLNNTVASINVSGLLNGTYEWKVVCSINSTVYNESTENRTLIITNPPAFLSITLNSPANNYTTNASNITFNYTIVGTNTTYNATLYLNGTINATATNIQNNTPSLFNITYIGPGIFRWNITAYISATVYNHSQTYNFTVVTTTTTTTTTTPPQISVCQVNATTVIQGQSINISSRIVNNSAYGISSAWYQLNSSYNITYTNSSGNHFSALINTSGMYGNYSIRCWGNDSLNARNYTINGSFVVVTTTTTTTTTLGAMLIRYRFSENRSDYIVNSAGSVNGTIIGLKPTWLPNSVDGGGIRFDGKQTILAGLENKTYNQFTLFVCAANITKEGNLISYRLTSGHYLRIYGYTDGSVNFDAPYPGQGFKTNMIYKTGYHCYTLSCDGSKCYAYVDKKYERSLTYAGNFTSYEGVYVGARNASGIINENVSADIDEVRVYSRNLSHAEINSTVDELLPSADSTLISFINPIVNGSKINASSASINLSFQTPNLSSFRININNKDYYLFNNSLVLALNLDNNSAIGEGERTVIDFSAHQRNGSFRGSSSWTNEGKFGGAALLSGGVIDFSDDANLSFSGNNSHTIMFWIYLNSCNTGTAQYILESDENYQIQIWGCRIYYIQKASDWSWRREWRSAETYPAVGQWQHITIVFDGDIPCSANSVNMLVDGTPIEVELSNCDGGQWIDAATTKFRIGGAYYGETPSYTLNGKIDEFRLYRGKLSTKEIKYTYNSYLRKINSTSWAATVNLTQLSDGTYNYYGYVNDLNGAYARTDSGDIRTFFINTSPIYSTPIISEVKVTYLSQNQAVITWKTDLASSSLVEYGLNESYGYNATTGGNTYNHTVVLTGLVGNTVYHFRVVSNASNMIGNSTDYTFRTAYIYSINNTNTTANQTTTITVPNTNLSLDLVTNTNAYNISLNVTSTTHSPLSAGINAVDLGKYIQIDASSELTDTLKYAIIKIYYADYEVLDAGIKESDLSIYWYNTGSQQWIRLTKNIRWVHETGINSTANYVWANVTHFSYYALGGLENSCNLKGDYSPCGIVTITEVINLINQWVNDEATLSEVIALINAWAAST